MRILPGQAARLSPGPAPITRDGVVADQRRRILEAAVNLIAKRGYQDTTIELIVRRAKVGYATFNKNFADKEECLLAIADAAAVEARKAMTEAVEKADGPWPNVVAEGLRALFELIASKPAAARVVLVETLTAGPSAVARYERALKDLGQFLRPGREFSPSKDALPDTLEDTLAGGVFWIAYQRLIIGEADRLQALLPETIELVLTPYVGEDEAVRVAYEYAVPPTVEPA
jgi:AcrR family transcriptional regulator